MATNTKKLTSLLTEFHFHFHDRREFIFKLQSFNLRDEEIKNYLRAVDGLMKYDKAAFHWQIALEYYRRKYRFQSIRELDKVYHLPLDKKLRNAIEKLNQTINTIKHNHDEQNKIKIHDTYGQPKSPRTENSRHFDEV